MTRSGVTMSGKWFFSIQLILQRLCQSTINCFLKVDLIIGLVKRKWIVAAFLNSPFRSSWGLPNEDP
jgi:hypothetical protein